MKRKIKEDRTKFTPREALNKGSTNTKHRIEVGHSLGSIIIGQNRDASEVPK